MIRVKITPMGGYVLGDGECPFDPDEFMLAFADKIADARARGLRELGISDDEIQQMKDGQHELMSKFLRDTPVRTLRNNQSKRILDVVGQEAERGQRQLPDIG